MSQPQTESNLHLLDYLRVVRVRWAIILLIFVLVLITTGVVTFVLPRQYESKAMIQVQQNADFEIFHEGNRGAKAWDPRFASTQFEILQSKEILTPVVERLGLQQKWLERYEIKSRELIFRKLKRMMTLREVRGTDLISVTILSPGKEEAADIANAIAKQYIEARIKDQQSWVTRSLATLREEVEKQRSKAEELRTKASKIRVEYGINDLNPEGVEDLMQATERVLLNDEELVSTARNETAAKRARAEQLSHLTDDQIMRTAATLQVEDQTIRSVLPLYQEAEAEEQKLLKAGLGKNHPSVKAQAAQKDSFLSQLKAQIASTRAAFEAELKISEESLKSVEKNLEISRKRQQEAKIRSALYYEAKNDYIQAKKVLEAADVRYVTEMMQRSMPLNPAIIWENAEPSEFPARPRVWLNCALGVFFGLLLGFGLAFLIEYLDTSVKTMEDIERFFDLPVLAVVPCGIRVLMDMPPDAPDAEPYRILRTNIEFNRKSPDANSVTLVSGGPGEGKSTTLTNLAFVIAQSGLKTIVVDADLRRPSQHKLFGVNNNRGLSDFLSKGVPIDELIVHSRAENLHVIPAGRSSHSGSSLLNSRQMTDLIDRLKQTYDMVLVDAPPILGVSDSSVIVRAVDITAIIIQHRRFPRAMLVRVKNAVLNAGGNLLGAVLNNVDIRLDQYYQYQTNYYGYHEDEKLSRANARDARKVAAAISDSSKGRDDY